MTVQIRSVRPSILDYMRAISADSPSRESELVLSHRTAVGAGATSSEDHSALAGFAGIEELRVQIEQRLLLSRLVGAHRIGFRTAVPFQVDPSASAGWVSEGRGKPVSPFAAREVALPRRKVAGLAVCTKELLRPQPGNETQILRLLASSVSARANATLLSADEAVEGEAPAGLGAVAEAVLEGDTLLESLEGMVAAADSAGSDLSSAAWLMSPARAVAAAVALNSENLGLRGGTLLGAPVLVDRSAESRVYLLVSDRLAYAVGDVDLDTASHASLEMDPSPTGHATTPAAATSLVSLFQTNSVGFLAELPIAWEVLPGGAFIMGAES